MSSNSQGSGDDAEPLMLHEDRRAMLARYVELRLEQLMTRQFGIAIAGLLLMAFDGVVLGVCVYVLSQIGETVENGTARRVGRKLTEGMEADQGFRLTLIAAAVQSVILAACVHITFFSEGTGQAPLFSYAFLIGMAANGGLLMAYHPAATRIRLIVFGLTFASLLTGSLILTEEWGPRLVLETVGAAFLAFYMRTFLDTVYSGMRMRRRQDRVMQEQATALAATNAAMRRRQREMHRLNLVARNANDSVILSRPGGHISWVNDAFTRITGYSREDAVGRRIGDLLNGPETNPETIGAIADAVRHGRPFRGEILNYTKSGEKIWIETNIVPVAGEDGRTETVVAVERDVSVARRQAAELAAAKLAAEEGAQAKAEFLATMSHEIRTPMNGVIGMADLLSETDLTEEQRLYADTIRGSAQALLTVINDVLDLSKLDAGKMRLSPVDFDLPDSLRGLVRLLGPQAQDKNLQLILDIGGDLARWVKADDGRLRQVLLNLVGNAIKFTDRGSVTLKARTRDTGGSYDLTLTVADTGIGIAPDKLDHVFERFSQAEATTTRRFGGTGLGLTIARMLVEAMGGRIEVASEPGRGTTFTIRLKLGYGNEAAVAAAAAQPRLAAAAMARYAGLSILVAEDNRVNRLLIQKLLQDIPVLVDFAHDGQEAVDKVRTQAPDIVFMDMSMPVMSGIEATKQIRAGGGPQPAIVALTANAFACDRAECLEAGMDAFLSKPVRKAELFAAIRAHCTALPRRAAE
ncbi:hybrid sensor histidine kinase/response regulator [Chachezhania sediminis]|uniref:hybrid sensor histidine kinase/response regulator n=1 Tax=Chachezhania sediminis TaxID=2599291 RepID=UPI00131E0645|nr:ATP-binding protein [Chachezhania sediminis]